MERDNSRTIETVSATKWTILRRSERLLSAPHHFGIIKYSLHNAEVDDSECSRSFIRAQRHLRADWAALDSLFTATYRGWNTLNKGTLAVQYLDDWGMRTVGLGRS